MYIKRENAASLKVRGESNQIIILAILIVAVLVATAFWLSRDVPDNEVETAPLVVTSAAPVERQPVEPLPAPQETIARDYQLQGELPPLLESDDPLKAHLRLLAGALPVTWLSGDQILQKVVLQVESAADGDLIYQHSPILAPPAGMTVLPTTEEGVYLLDRSSYARYNLYADFLAGLDSELLTAFYRYYEPLLDQAYVRLGNEPDSFRARFAEALDEVLAAPRVEGDIRLTRPLLSYEYENPELESLSMVQKQLLRMGPANTRKIQDALEGLRDYIR